MADTVSMGHVATVQLKRVMLVQCFAGIVTVSVGHCHDQVMKAVNRQNSLLQHTTTIYLNDQVALFAKELAERMPGNLKVMLVFHEPG